MKLTIAFTVLLIAAACSSPLDKRKSEITKLKYSPDWVSLKHHHNPQWLSDAKFGIYTHWRPDAGSEPGTFKAEKFNADEWAELFKQAGAQFAGPVTEHGGARVLMWDSKLSDNTSVKRGLNRDIVAELQKAITKRGMKFMVSFHSFGPKESRMIPGGKAWEVVDKYQPDLVWFDLGMGNTLPPHYGGSFIGGKKIANRTENNYQGNEKEIYRKQFLAHYFNQAVQLGKEVQVVYKDYDIPPGVAMRDIENGRLKDLEYDEWMADVTIMLCTFENNKYHDYWMYSPDAKFMSTQSLINELVDITSKNGRLLLSVGPKPDGSIPNEARERLQEMGKWLHINGEAIYGTTPWILYGEGPTELKGVDLGLYAQDHKVTFDGMLDMINKGEMQFGHFSQINQIPYTPQDIRFTTKGDAVYAICLGWPGEEITIKSLGTEGAIAKDEIKSIRMLGSDEELQWTQKPEGLVIKTPKMKPCEHAFTFKIIE